MAYGRIDNQTSSHGSWVEEQTAFIKEAGTDRSTLNFGDKFFEEFDNVVDTIKASEDIDIRKDVKRMMENKAVMEQYKELLLQPILKQFREELVNETEDKAMQAHLMECADNLEAAWDSARDTFIKESYNVANYMPLSTLDFPALVKQYIRFIGKEIIPVQTATSFNIEQRIMNKYLVNNQTGEEYEVPKVYFQREPDGTRTWRKLWNAGKGLRINDKDPLPLATIQAAPGKKFSIFKWLLDDEGNALDFTPQVTPRTRMSYDFHINYVQISCRHKDKAHCYGRYSENVLEIVKDIARREHVDHVFSYGSEAVSYLLFCCKSHAGSPPFLSAIAIFTALYAPS